MAYLPEDEKEDDELLEGQPGQGAPQTSSSAGVLDPATTAAGDGQQAGQGAPTGPKTDVKSYIDKNRTAVQRLGDRVGQSIRDRGNTARDTLGQQTQAFDSAVGTAETRDDAGFRNQLLADPTSVAKDSSQLARAKSMRDATYGGPMALEDTDFYSPVSRAYGEANQAGERTKTAGGRQELIASTIPQGQRFTKGRIMLDEALMSSDVGARNAVNAGRDSLSDLDKRLGEASAASRARAQQGVATTDATRQATRDTLMQSRSQFETDLDARLASARDSATKRMESATGALKAASGRYYGRGEEVAPEDLESVERFGAGNKRAVRYGEDTFDDQILEDLGLNRDLIGELMGGSKSDTGRYLQDFGRGLTAKQDKILQGKYMNDLGDLSRFAHSKSPDAEISRGNVASLGDYDRLDALNALTDEQSMFLDPGQRAMAGTAPQDLLDYDVEGLSKAYQNAMRSAQGNAASSLAKNSRSGGDSFVKKHGASIATGGIVQQGGGIKDFGKALTNPLDVVKRNVMELGADQNSMYYDPAQMLHDNPLYDPQAAALDYLYNDEELV